MKKTIIKTAVITLVALIVASGVLFGILCLCAPATMRDFFYDAGNYQTAMNFAERACEKNETPENIKKATDVAILTGDSDNIALYCKKLLNCAKHGEISLTVDYVYYVAGKFSVALCEKQNFENAVKVAIEYSSGYGKLNPTESVILWGIENKNVQLLNTVLTKLTEFKQNNYDKLEQVCKDRLNTDIANLTAYLNG